MIHNYIGLFQNAGVTSTFKLMKYFGILDARESMFDVPPSCPEGSAIIHALIPDFELLEDLMKYRFKNKAHLLQALTHPSFLGNSATDSYEKLEFLGDAVLGMC